MPVAGAVHCITSGSGLLGRLVCAKPDVMIGDMHLFRDRVLISDTARLSDDQLVESMAQGDPKRDRASTQSCPVRVQCFDWNAVKAAPLGVYWNDC